MTDDLHAEFVNLVGGFAAHLRAQKERGVDWVPSGPSQTGDGEVQEPQALSWTLEDIRADLGDCTRCKLCKGRKNIVFGVGNPSADLMFIGEGPGRDEDIQGEPFVGKAGQLLTKMIKAMGLERDDVYIANIVKCRPPNNRDPEADEIDACEPFLRKQIEIIQPAMIVALGNFAARTLIRTGLGIMKLRGKWHAYCGIPLMPTFHPAYLLRNAQGKRPVWNDLQAVMGEMDRLGLYRRR